jgi:hypothetical protein
LSSWVIGLTASSGGWRLVGRRLRFPRTCCDRGRVRSCSDPGLTAGIIIALAGSFGLAISGVGAVATGTIEQPLAFLTELIALLGAGLLVGTAQSWLRLRRGVCSRCGSSHRGYPTGPLIHPAPSAASAGLRRTAYLMLLGLLPWATVKLIWGLAAMPSG